MAMLTRRHLTRDDDIASGIVPAFGGITSGFGGSPTQDVSRHIWWTLDPGFRSQVLGPTSRTQIPDQDPAPRTLILVLDLGPKNQIPDPGSGSSTWKTLATSSQCSATAMPAMTMPAMAMTAMAMTTMLVMLPRWRYSCQPLHVMPRDDDGKSRLTVAMTMAPI